MRRVWLSTLVLAIGALAASFVLTESSRVAAEGRTVTAGSSAVTIQSSEQMTVMVSSMLYLPVVGGGSANLQPTPVPTPTPTSAIPSPIPTSAIPTAPVSAEEGGSLSATLGSLETAIHIPTGAISENATLVVQVATAPPSPGNLRRYRSKAIPTRRSLRRRRDRPPRRA